MCRILQPLGVKELRMTEADEIMHSVTVAILGGKPTKVSGQQDNGLRDCDQDKGAP